MGKVKIHKIVTKYHYIFITTKRIIILYITIKNTLTNFIKTNDSKK